MGQTSDMPLPKKLLLMPLSMLEPMLMLTTLNLLPPPPMLPWPLVQMPMLDLLLGRPLTPMLLMMLEQSMMPDSLLPMLLLVMPGTPVPTSILLTGVEPLLLTECGTERSSVDNDVY